MRQQTDYSGAIWVLGIALVLAVAATSPYWQQVAIAAGTGYPPSGAGQGATAGAGGLWLTLGAFLMVILLAGLAEVSSGGGGLALALLLGLCLLFLLGHVKGVSAFFARFTA